MPLLSMDVQSVVQFVTVIIIFVFVLALTYGVTKWTANFQKGRMNGGKIEVIESFRIAPDKYIQIVRVTEKYMAIAIAKETVTFLAELSEDDIVVRDVSGNGKASFGELLDKVREKKVK